MTSPLVSSHYTEGPFEAAKRDFLHDLKNSSRSSRDANLHREILATATNIDQVYQAVEKLQDDQFKNGHMRNVARIGPFLQILESYASSIEVFVSAKPEILALIWGPIKLLLLWTSNVKNAFEAIMDTVAKIGQLLPQFNRVREVIRDDDRIKGILGLFYRDILDVYSVALKFFGQSSMFLNETTRRFILCANWLLGRVADLLQLIVASVQRPDQTRRGQHREALSPVPRGSNHGSYPLGTRIQDHDVGFFQKE